MKRSDAIFIIFCLLLAVFLVIPVTGTWFFNTLDIFPLVGGFVKFFLFATIGDIIATRLKSDTYKVKGLFFKACIWGLIGVVITFVFPLFFEGVTHLQAIAYLPFKDSALMHAFFVSLFMNLIFGPTMMAFHRVTDGYIEGKLANSDFTLLQSVDNIDWRFFTSFVLFKTLPLFWIPAHTITFLLPGQYRVFFAALLGIALGLILGISKRKQTV